MGEPKPPAGLKAKGKALFRAVIEEYDLRADEMALLASACRQVDEIGDMERILRKAPTMIPGSRGQMRPHPLLAELRQHRLALAKLLAQLDFSTDAVDQGLARSDSGRKLARLRWGGGTA
jgi:hypothetical protein